MRVKNTDTGKIEEIFHAAYQTDVMADIIGNCGCPEMGWDEDEEVRTASTETIEWWQTYADRDAEMIEKKNEILQSIEDDAERELFERWYSEAVAGAGDLEMEYECGMEFLVTYDRPKNEE